MKKSLQALSLSLAAGAMLLSTQALADSKCSLKDGKITVQGTGTMKVMPDEAVLSFSVTEIKDNAAAARNSVEERVTGFITALKPLNLGQNQILADNLTVFPKYSYNEGKSKLEGYSAYRVVKVTVDNLELIPKVTDLALESGINEVAGFEYQVKDLESVKKEAAKLAIKDAKEKAQLLADGFEVKIAHPCDLQFVEAGSIMPYRNHLMMAKAASDNAAVEASYEVQPMTVTTQVNAVFSLK